MAIPQDSRYLNQVLSTTRDEVRDELVDLFFNSNPLFAKLMAKNRVRLAGGDEIRVPFLYDKLPGGAYSGLGPFPGAQKEVLTVLRFDWKQNYAEFTLPAIDIFKNAEPHRQIDLAASMMKAATITIADNVGTQLFNDGTNAQEITGLRLATNTTGTYGKVVRGADTIGTAVKGVVDTTGGPVTVPLINSVMGSASRGGAQKPDLLITTQVLWDAVWSRLQTQQRQEVGAGKDVFPAGFRHIDINGSALVADSHCPAGYIFGLNTDYVDFYVGEGKDFAVRGPFELHNQDGFTTQIVLYAELALKAPSLCFQMSGLIA